LGFIDSMIAATACSTRRQALSDQLVVNTFATGVGGVRRWVSE
jgi:hypothetical protein